MNPGDLARVTRAAPDLKGVVLVLEIMPAGSLVTPCRCLNSDGKIMKVPLSWLEVISESR